MVLNRALLQRQMLLERTDLSVPNVLEQMAGLQAQYAPAMYVGLWSRVRDLRRDLVTELLVKRDIVQGTLLRGTIHLVSKRDYWPFAAGIRVARREWYLRVTKKTGPSEQSVLKAADVLRRALRDGPLRTSQIDELIGRDNRGGVGLFVDLVRVPPSGTWERRRADLFGLAEEWVGPDTASEVDGIELLVRRYLGGFGPSTRHEIADWAGLPVTAIDPVLAALDLRRFRAEDGAELLDLPDAPLPDPQTPAPVRFLAQWDAALLAHARRSGILPEEYRPRIFNTKMPQSVGTFLVDGSVAGTWKLVDGRVKTEEFHKLGRATRRELADEAERLTAFYS
jgi:hypothetical protein